MVGFGLFVLAIPLALAALVAGLVGLVRTRQDIRAGRREKVAEFAPAFFEEPLVDPGTQSSAAWSLLSESPEPLSNSELALKLAERAAARTQRSDWAILATLALALQADGQRERASATRQEAMALCRASEAVENCDKFEGTLEKLFKLLL